MQQPTCACANVCLSVRWPFAVTAARVAFANVVSCSLVALLSLVVVVFELLLFAYRRTHWHSGTITIVVAVVVVAVVVTVCFHHFSFFRFLILFVV